MVVAIKEHPEYDNEEVVKLDSMMIPVIVGQLPRTGRPIAVGFIKAGGPYPTCRHSAQGI